ncbi:MAG TPA: ABC transporter ATP-binding protein [Actinomycetota bacterium]|nr:ABC transporter ATP-binding protein [Actinomycetota bacterium]
MSLTVRGLSKTYVPSHRGEAKVRALEDVELAASDGELVVVVGPSGSGKTTLLRCVAGLERADHGSIEVAGRDVTDTPPGERDVAMVFQEFALYPHINVEENISFGLRARRMSPDEIKQRVTDASALLSLDGVLHRLPSELSGGERQRVALARAIVRTPSVFLLDEPLANLDAGLRATTRAEIRALQRRLETTMLYVTHDQTEAMTVGDRVTVLRAGRVEQTASPTELYERPATAFVAGFIGHPPMNLLPGGLVGHATRDLIGVRPERIRLVASDEGRIAGRIVASDDLGGERVIHVDVGGHRVLVRTNAPALAPGVEAGLSFLDADVHLFDHEGRALR